MPHITIQIEIEENHLLYPTVAQHVARAFQTYHDAVAQGGPVSIDDSGVILDSHGERIGTWDVSALPMTMVHPDEQAADAWGAGGWNPPTAVTYDSEAIIEKLRADMEASRCEDCRLTGGQHMGDCTQGGR